MRGRVFQYGHQSAAQTDKGLARRDNQDKIIRCPELGFFAVSDGMGGLIGGGETAALLAQSVPAFVGAFYPALKKNPRAEYAAKIIGDYIKKTSAGIFEKMNHRGQIIFGATFCGVWLVGGHAVFFNLGDSRGYLLGCSKNILRQITKDHTSAALLRAGGQLRPQVAGRPDFKNELSRFVGMKSPATPDIFIEIIGRGDTILLCSDGLSKMVDDGRLAHLLRLSKNPDRVVTHLIDAANKAGGKDNIAAVYIKVL